MTADQRTAITTTDARTTEAATTAGPILRTHGSRPDHPHGHDEIAALDQLVVS